MYKLNTLFYICKRIVSIQEFPQKSGNFSSLLEMLYFHLFLFSSSVGGNILNLNVY